jgi:putative flippase GtrA
VNWSEAKETGKQIRRFLVVGSLCVLTDLAVYYAMLAGVTLSISSAKAISYLAGVAVGFVLNKLWTFESKRKTWSEPASYLSLYLATLAVNVFSNQLMLALVGSDHRLLSFFVATGVTTVLNFLGMRLLTFRHGIAERRSAASMPENESTVPRRKVG